jgi:peptide/nickel transport system substrate-binding protein
MDTGTPKMGGIIRFAQIAGPAGYDLHMRASWAGSPLVPIYNNLVQLNQAYQEVVSANVIGDLAKDWTISPDGLNYTFNLNQGAKWHDGKPFTADDVVYSITKMLDPKKSLIGTTLAGIDKVEKVNDFTVTITTKYPSPSLLINLAGAYAVIQPKHLADVDNKKTDFLIGTGPYMFKDYSPDSYWELKKNPGYFKKDRNGNALPYLDGIKIFILKSIDASTNAFITKQLDTLSPIQILYTPNDVNKVTSGVSNAKITTNKADTPYFIHLNMKFKPFQDPKVRKAMGLIYNSEDQLLARLGSLEYGQPGRGLFAEFWANPPSEVAKIMGWAGKTYDQRVQEAQKLMKESAYPDGFSVRMLYTNVPGAHSEPSFIQFGDALKKHLNIKYELKPFATTVETLKVRDAGEWEMFNQQLLMATPDPDSYMAFFRTGASTNFMSYSNPEVDKLWDAQTKEMDVIKRQEMLKKIEAMIMADMPVFPGAFLQGKLFFHPWVMNFGGQTKATYGPENKLEIVWMDGQPK